MNVFNSVSGFLMEITLAGSYLRSGVGVSKHILLVRAM